MQIDPPGEALLQIIRDLSIGLAVSAAKVAELEAQLAEAKRLPMQEAPGVSRIEAD